MRYDRSEYVGARWFTSSYSAAQAQCVELAFLAGHRWIRDSKLGEASPVLAVTPAHWSAFTAAAKAGSLNG
ncbi:MAG: DUF397 domain-containing protein [Pseudonocardiaceae bacterium]